MLKISNVETFYGKIQALRGVNININKGEIVSVIGSSGSGKSTLLRMNQMKLYGMHGAFKTAIESGKTDHYTLDQFVSMIIDAEWDERHNRRIERSIKNARFHYKSNIETINFDQARNLDRNMVLRLAECEFVEKNENILITGSTGVGKSYLGTALGYQACIQGFKVSYFNTSKLFYAAPLF